MIINFNDLQALYVCNNALSLSFGCRRVEQKILPSLKKLRHWKMCRFQRTSHFIFMLRTATASHFLIFMPPVDNLQLSNYNCFDFNIVSDLIKCFTLFVFCGDFLTISINVSEDCNDFFPIIDDLMLYLSGSYNHAVKTFSNE